MHYDVAAKVVVERGKEAILHRFLGMEPDSIELIEELPEETVSLRRSDFPLLVVLKDGREVIVLLEIQTLFRREFLWRLVDYCMRFRLKYRLEVIPVVLLLTPSSLASGVYEDELITFRYKAVRFWEMRAAEVLDEVWLYPFVPLMEGGEGVLEEVERRVYEASELEMEEKGDVLTAMAIFAGLRDKEVAMKLIQRRRDIMIQSAAYEIIKGEGLKEGLREGMLEDARDLLLEALEVKFEVVPLRLVKSIHGLDDRELLKSLHRHAIRGHSLEEFEERMRRVMGEV